MVATPGAGHPVNASAGVFKPNYKRTRASWVSAASATGDYSSVELDVVLVPHEVRERLGVPGGEFEGCR